MAANPGCVQQPITLEEIDLLSFLCQNVARKLELEARAQGLAETYPRVLRAVTQHFNLGPASHHNFDRLVWRVAHGQ